MPVNLAEFAQQIEAAKALVPAKHLELQKSVAAEYFSDVVQGTPDETPPTPYRTGYARANWMPSIGEPSDAVLPPFQSGEAQAFTLVGPQTHLDRGEQGLSPDEAASMSMERLPGVLNQAEPFQTIFIANNVPYIQDLENGTSSQASSGFVNKAHDAVIGRYGR